MRISVSASFATVIALSVVAGFVWGWQCGLFVFATPFIVDFVQAMR